MTSRGKGHSASKPCLLPGGRVNTSGVREAEDGIFRSRQYAMSPLHRTLSQARNLAVEKRLTELRVV